MNHLDEMLRVLIKDERLCKIKARESKSECKEMFTLRFPHDKPYVKLELVATRDRTTIDTHEDQIYNLAEGHIPTVADFLHAHLKADSKTKYGPVKRLNISIEESARIQASAQFTADNKLALNPVLQFANSHLKGELVTRLGQNLVIDGKRNGEGPDYHHVRQISSSQLGARPYYLTDPVDCVKFMHRVYTLLTK